MKTTLIRKDLIVKKSPIHGFGVFAETSINTNDIIEECTIILLSEKSPSLTNYAFDAGGKSAVLTGYGFIYNHSEEPNANYFVDAENKIATFRALRVIQKGEEIFTSYGKDWFDNRSLSLTRLSKWRKWLHPRTSFPLRAFIACATLLLIKHYISYLG